DEPRSRTARARRARERKRNLSPWWLRPTAEGANDDEAADKKKAEPIPQAAAPLPAHEERTPEPDASHGYTPASLYLSAPEPAMAAPAPYAVPAPRPL